MKLCILIFGLEKQLPFCKGFHIWHHPYCLVLSPLSQKSSQDKLGSFQQSQVEHLQRFDHKKLKLVWFPLHKMHTACLIKQDLGQRNRKDRQRICPKFLLFFSQNSSANRERDWCEEESIKEDERFIKKRLSSMMIEGERRLPFLHPCRQLEHLASQRLDLSCRCKAHCHPTLALLPLGGSFQLPTYCSQQQKCRAVCTMLPYSGTHRTDLHSTFDSE